MTGGFIIEGQYDDDLNKFYGEAATPPKPPPTMTIRGLRSGCVAPADDSDWGCVVAEGASVPSGGG